MQVLFSGKNCENEKIYHSFNAHWNENVLALYISDEESCEPMKSCMCTD